MFFSSSEAGSEHLSLGFDSASILVAATEGKSILIFDPLNHKLIREVKNAHSDCVNYARFLDSRTFATCSDDTTVALWDVRNLKRKIRSLVGHSNWVKNIEYASAEGLLVTSGFDGSIHTWDINKFSENGTEFQRIFYTTGLMRMRLTPDNKKMWTCVHDIQEQPPQESGSSGSLSAAGSSSCEDRDWPDTDSEIEDEILVGGLAGGGEWGRRQPGIEPLWDGDWDALVSEGTMEEAMALLSGQPPLVGLQSLGRPGSSKDVRCKASQPRLLHYAQEPNRGRGWIKELCFSTDGRLVCSPLERGVRLLAFDSDFRNSVTVYLRHHLVPWFMC
ncbi:hypothetical protein HPB52_014616 [Rhipicephalus sanguineus]|uniref:WD repeat-containing protein 32 n=1 Tax=Rhipicephalus sanguineus TaxID=34632 RepID=A0A9D4YQ25_RHISA|nr:hypothetical protein HPB52_014616 [Rhipicephalus sanguineus]